MMTSKWSAGCAGAKLLLVVMTLYCIITVQVQGAALKFNTVKQAAVKRRLMMDTKENQKKFLEHYQYFGSKCPDAKMRRLSTKNPDVAFRLAVTAFQKNYNLKLTGKVDEATRKLMEKPRCGQPDYRKGDTILGKSKRRKRYATRSGLNTTWLNQFHYTYRVNNYPTNTVLSQSAVNTIISDAINKWARYAPISFTQTYSDNVDIDILFGAGSHTSNSIDSSFDGPGGVLAHAFYPLTTSGDFMGDAHFDDDEDWTYRTGSDFDLFVVAVHEFGHSMGISHSNEREAIMYAVYEYRSDIMTGELPLDDQQAIQSLYGNRTGGPPNPVTPSAGTPPDFCNTALVDAAVSFDDWNVNYIFQGAYFIIVSSTAKVTPYAIRIDNYWQLNGHDELSEGIDEALYLPQITINYWFGKYVWEKEKLYFFKGDYVYEVDRHENQVLSKTPIAVKFPGLQSGQSIQAAFYASNDRFYVIQNGMLYVVSRMWHPIARSVTSVSSLAQYRYVTFTSAITLAYFDPDLGQTSYHVYLFTNRGLYYKLDVTKSVDELVPVAFNEYFQKPFPLSVSTYWLYCQLDSIQAA